MPTLEQVWKEVNALPHRYIFYTRKEINYLPNILGVDEHILALTSGMMNSRTWLAVCTNRRVLFLDRGMFFGLRQVQINLDKLQTIESDVSLFFGTIRVIDAGSSMTIRMVLKSSIAPFIRTVQEAMDRYKRQMVFDLARATTSALPHADTPHGPHVDAMHPAAVGVSHAAPTAPHTMIDELERLAKLKADGHLTDAEYTTAKATLLHH